MSESTNRRIAFSPLKDINNAYVSRMQSLLSNFGVIEEVEGIKKILFRFLRGDFRGYDVVWLNWPDNEMLNSSGRISYFRTIKLFVRTAIMVALANKSVFVRHNNYPHKTHPKSIGLAKLLVSIYERLFDTVVTHSGAEAKAKKIYCPHPLYQIVSDTANTCSLPTTLPRQYFIAFGRIVPYKKLEFLIKSFPPDETLVVAGSVGDQNYANNLGDIKQDNFIFMPGYLTEDQAQKLVSGAEAVVISHAAADMIVSGTFCYAMSLCKPVFAVETEFLKWIKLRIAPGLLTLAQDMDSLSNLINQVLPNPDAIRGAKSIQDEFGDEAVITALSRILGLP